MGLMITPEAVARGRGYLFTYGRPLDQARFRYQFEGGDATAVVAALATFQNPDGGFGNALEPDIRASGSSVIAATVGLALLREVEAPAGESVVASAINYLLENYDPDAGVWPIIGPSVEEAPHAPWWDFADSEKNFGGFLANPRAAVVGHLQYYNELVEAGFLRGLRSTAIDYLEQLPDKIDQHDILVYLDLMDAAGLTEADRQRIERKIRTATELEVATDPSLWAEYKLQPLDVAPHPDSTLADCFDDRLLTQNLKYVIESQLPDGSWPLPWSWDFIDAQAWAAAERDWKGAMIVNKLKKLANYGCLPGRRS